MRDDLVEAPQKKKMGGAAARAVGAARPFLTREERGMAAATHTLYVARSHRTPARFCAGSALCLRLVDRLPETLVAVEDCDELREAPGAGRLPGWLVGTPTLVTADGFDIYRGTEAVKQLTDLALEHAELAGRGGAPAAAPPAAKPGAPPAAKPAARRAPAAEAAPASPQASAARAASLDELWADDPPPEDLEEAEPARGGRSRKLTSEDLAQEEAARRAIATAGTPHAPPRRRRPLRTTDAPSPPTPPPLSRSLSLSLSSPFTPRGAARRAARRRSSRPRPPRPPPWRSAGCPPARGATRGRPRRCRPRA